MRGTTSPSFSLETRLRQALGGADREWRAAVLRLGPDDAPQLTDVCQRLGLRVRDSLLSQLADLAAVRLPGGSGDERDDFVRRVLEEAGHPIACGAWVLFPWDATLVHLLAEEDYLDVITSRNHDKITPEEQARLRSRTVGVMGLSVGAEAAYTIVQENLCGAIRLADFDELELSNLNRIGCGVDDLGENKAVLLARRIARLNPYMKVSLFAEGVTSENLDAFLAGLDLLVEECDALEMKFLVRERARVLGLNVVFAADERGFLSVEPYAQAPGLLPFHGLVTERPRPRSSFSSPVAFMRSLTGWLGGWENISERSRRTLEMIGNSRCGYPQLAGEARQAAAQVSHVARRLLLGERLPPSVGFLDLEEMIPGAEQATRPTPRLQQPSSVSRGG